MSAERNKRPVEPVFVTSPEAAAAVAAGVKVFNQAMEWAKASFVIGNSFMLYRRGNREEAAALIDGLAFEQREMVRRWAAWVAGVGE